MFALLLRSGKGMAGILVTPIHARPSKGEWSDGQMVHTGYFQYFWLAQLLQSYCVRNIMVQKICCLKEYSVFSVCKAKFSLGSKGQDALPRC